MAKSSHALRTLLYAIDDLEVCRAVYVDGGDTVLLPASVWKDIVSMVRSILVNYNL